MAESIATRAAYGEALVSLAEQDPSLLVLDADLSSATMTKNFSKAYPDRFFNMGIAEANMIGVAAGLAACGKKPFANTFAMFAAGRAWEQVRNSVAYPHLNVKVVGSHGGLSVGEDGATHQCCEDLALMRTIPGMTVLNPADYVEAGQVVRAAVKMEGPVYMRFGRLAIPTIFDSTYRFEIGKGVQLTEGTDVTLIATGLLVGEAIKAAELLKNEGISVRVINMATIKPLDKEIVAKAAAETGLIVTAEEHSIIGGLGSAVAEAVCESTPVPVVRVGVEDEYGKSGPAAELLEVFGLCAANLAARVRDAMEIKRK